MTRLPIIFVLPLLMALSVSAQSLHEGTNIFASPPPLPAVSVDTNSVPDTNYVQGPVTNVLRFYWFTPDYPAPSNWPSAIIERKTNPVMPWQNLVCLGTNRPCQFVITNPPVFALYRIELVPQP